MEREGAAHKDLDWGHVIYLNNSAATVDIGERSITIFGSPVTLDCGTWAFQYPPIRDVWTGRVPRGTGVLLTHGPAKGHLDSSLRKGCGWLGNELWRTKPRLVVCGHIHQARGREDVNWDYLQRVYDGVQSGHLGIISVLGMLVVFAISKIWYKVSGGMPVGTTTFVNAAVVGGPGNSESHPATTVEI